MPTGLKIRGIDGDTDRVSVQSSEQPTHLLTRRRWAFLKAKWTEVSVGRDELMVLKCNHGETVIELKHVGGPDGALVIDDFGTHSILREGSVLRLVLRRDRAVFLRTQAFREPRKRGAVFAT
jgi:hypothetical protein